MKKLILKQAGWETFTGNFGGIEFLDGKSVDAVPAMFAQRIANILSVETEEGTNPSSSQTVLDSQKTEWFVAGSYEAQQAAVSTAAIEVKKAAEKVVFTRAELEDIASKSGLNGLRKLVEDQGIDAKATSILKMIDAILAAQGADAAEVNQAEEQVAALTEAPVAPVEAPTEAPVEAPTEAPVEAPVEAPTEAPAADQPTE